MNRASNMTSDSTGESTAWGSLFAKTITITDDDISQGTRGSAQQCPIARAVRRQTGRTEVKVGDGSGYIIINGHKINNPPFIIEFIRKFDDGEAVEPFAFNFVGLEGIPTTPPEPGSPVVEYIGEGNYQEVPGVFN